MERLRFSVWICRRTPRGFGSHMANGVVAVTATHIYTVTHTHMLLTRTTAQHDLHVRVYTIETTSASTQVTAASATDCWRNGRAKTGGAVIRIAPKVIKRHTSEKKIACR